MLYAYELPGNLVKIQIPVQQVWSGAQDPAFLTSSQVMPMLLVWKPHLSSKVLETLGNKVY